MLSGYSNEIQKLLKNKRIGIGQRVLVEKGKEHWEGFLMPARDKNHVVIKLENGYNIGIHFIKGTTITKKHERRQPKKSSTKIEKHRPDKGKPVIALFSTGGTVASRIDYKTGAVSAAFTPEELYIAVPELKGIANFKIHNMFEIFSQDMEAEHWIALAERIEEEIKEGADGIIITHGTDIMHYTSAALSFMVRNSPVPILLVGSQRSSDRGSSDAAMNMICAAQFILKSDFSGIAVCMHGSPDDEYCFIHDPTNVRKMHTSRRDTFRSIDRKPFAKVHQDGELEWIRNDYKKANKKREPDVDAVFDKHIAIIKSHPCFNTGILEYYEKEKVKGIIIEGTGLGHLPNDSRDKYTKHHNKINKTIQRMIKKGILIFMTSQCPYGRVNMDVYSPQRVLIDAGIIPVRMTTETAFVKLGWALGQTKDKEEVKKIMMKDYAGETVERIDPESFLY